MRMAKFPLGHSLVEMVLIKLIPFTASHAFRNCTSRQNLHTLAATLSLSSGTKYMRL